MYKEISCKCQYFCIRHCADYKHREGLGKKNELFFFFRIKSGQGEHFREDLRSVIPLITTTTEAKKFHETIREGKKEAAKEGKKFPMIENSGVNISFSQKGLVAVSQQTLYRIMLEWQVADTTFIPQLGLTDDIGDELFKNGMLADAGELGDKLEEWDADFKKEIHGVFSITANSTVVLERTLDRIKRIFRFGHKDATIEEVTRLQGQVRPGAESGHEQ